MKPQENLADGSDCGSGRELQGACILTVTEMNFSLAACFILCMKARPPCWPSPCHLWKWYRRRVIGPMIFRLCSLADTSSNIPLTPPPLTYCLAVSKGGNNTTVLHTFLKYCCIEGQALPWSPGLCFSGSKQQTRRYSVLLVKANFKFLLPVCKVWTILLIPGGLSSYGWFSTELLSLALMYSLCISLQVRCYTMAWESDGAVISFFF